MISNYLERIIYRLLWLTRQQERSNQHMSELSLINRLQPGEEPQLTPREILDRFWINKQNSNLLDKLKCEYRFKENEWKTVFASKMVDNIHGFDNIYCCIKNNNLPTCLFKIYVKNGEEIFSFGYYPSPHSSSYWVDLLEKNNLYHIPIATFLFGKRYDSIKNVPIKDLDMWEFCMEEEE